MEIRNKTNGKMNVDEALTFLENLSDESFTDSEGIKNEQKSLDLYIELLIDSFGADSDVDSGNKENVGSENLSRNQLLPSAVLVVIKKRENNIWLGGIG